MTFKRFVQEYIPYKYFHAVRRACRTTNPRVCFNSKVLSLGFYFDHDDVALEGVGPLLPRIGGTEVQRRPATFENAKPVLQLYLFQDVQKPSQDVCGKTQDASETAILREKTLDQAPFESACLFILFKPWK